MIHLESIVLKNFKRHENFTAKFTGGVNLVCGANYSGKSTLLHAVLFALFGARAVPCSADDLVRRGAKRMEVVLSFGGHGEHYVLSRSKSNAELLRNTGDTKAEVLAVGHSAVNSKVEEILGLTYKRFVELRYAEQKKTETMLTLGATQLHALLEELSGAGTVNAAIKRCSEIQTEQNAVLGALGDIAGKDVPALNAQRANLAEQLAAAADPEALRAVYNDACIALNTAKQNLEGAREHNRQVRAAGTALAVASGLHATALAAFSVAAKAYDAAKLNPALQADVAALRQRAAKIRAEWDGYAAARRSYDDWRQRAGNATDACDAALDKAGAADAAVDAAVAAYEAEGGDEAMAALGQSQRDLEARIAALKARRRDTKHKLENGVCTACQRPYEDAAAHMAEWQEELAKIATEGEAEVGKLNWTVDKLSILSRLSSDLATARGAYDAAAAEVQRLEGIRGAVLAAEPPVPGEPPSEDAKRQAQALDDEAAEAEAAGRRVAQLQAEAKAAEATLGREALAVGKAQEAVDALGAERQEPVAEEQAANAAYLDAMTRCSNAEQLVSNLRNQIAGIDRELEHEEKIAGKREEATRRRDVAKNLWGYLRDNRDRFMGQVWGSIMASATAFVSSCTGGDIERVFRGDDGEFRYVEKGEEFSARGSASGAQRSLMGLGVQIAMSQLARCPLAVLLMDEPSADMDAKVSAAMTGLLSTLGLQVVMVSHREMDASLAANTIVTEEAA